MSRTIQSFAFITAVLALSMRATAQATFTPLGDLPGGIVYSVAGAVSADGTVVVGTSASLVSGSSVNEAFVWTSATGMHGQGDLAGGPFDSHGYDVSSPALGGLHLVGVGSSLAGYEAYRDMIGLGDLPGLFFDSRAWAVSDDGARVVGDSVGLSGTEAFVWTVGATMLTPLGTLAGGTFPSSALAISGDGRIVAGYAYSASGQEAFRFDTSVVSGTMIGLGVLPGGSHNSIARGCSRDGSVIVGESDSAAGMQGFRWSAATGMVGLGIGPRAYACSSDGSVIVGGNPSSLDGAWIWDATHGGRQLSYVLRNDYLLESALTGWTLIEATGISDDGKTVCGNGYSPSGDLIAWVAHLVQPPMYTYCYGDGALNSCPCGNYSVYGAKEGCQNSTMLGGKLVGSGTPSIASDTLVLTNSHVPGSASALYFQGNAQTNSGVGTLNGDGLLCVGSGTIRLATKTSSGGVSTYPTAGDPHISVKGMCAAGQTKYYQVWYRDPSSVFCPPATYNFSNAIAVLWAP
jgi:probable HAF family extracellular repeat protein